MPTSQKPDDGWFDCVYSKEIHEYLKKKELRKTLQLRSPELCWRTNLVSFLKSICSDFKLSSLVFHLSVLLLDHFMDNHSIVSEKLKPVALACLSVAAKYEEIDDKIPKASELLQYNHHITSKRDLRSLEMAIQNYFNWSLGMPTIANFIQYYMQHALSSNYEYCRSSLNERINDFVDLCVFDPTLMQYRSSLLAASCVLCARHDLGLLPPWTNRLVQITGYTYLELEECFRHLDSSLQNPWSPTQQKRKLEGGDMGYESMSPADGKKRKIY